MSSRTEKDIQYSYKTTEKCILPNAYFKTFIEHYANKRKYNKNKKIFF